MLSVPSGYCKNISFSIVQKTTFVSITKFNAQFHCSITIYMLHHNPRNVSSINMPIRCTVQPFTGSDDTRCCDNKICPPEDGYVDARNMSKIVM